MQQRLGKLLRRDDSMRRGGWFQNSDGHRMAAKGIKLYPDRKRVLVNPTFYAKKEQALPLQQMIVSARQKKTYPELLQQYKDADPEEVRKKGIMANEMVDADNTLSYIDAHGVDATVRMAKLQPDLAKKIQNVLQNPQKRSFLHPVKVASLQKNLNNDGREYNGFQK